MGMETEVTEMRRDWARAATAASSLAWIASSDTSVVAFAAAIHRPLSSAVR
jgi:hypothetical protein